MKTPFLFFLYLLAGISCYAQTQESLHLQITDRLRLRGVLKESATDSVMKIERLAALKFHTLINQYRKENKLDTIRFNDTLWLASRNHCIWMKQNDQLSHIQEANTPSYTGDDPGDRYDFVVNNAGNCSWTGENAQYNYVYGSRIAEMADVIAQRSFASWKSSPGHNANMLRDRHWQHAAAYILEPSGRFWGCDLFTSKPYYAPSISSTSSVSESVAATQEKRKKFNQQQAQMQLLDELYKNSGESNRSDDLQAAAQLHVDYLAINRKKFSHEQTEGKRNFSGATPEKRFKKAASFKTKKLSKKYKLIESIGCATYHVDDFDAKQAAEELIMLLNSEQKGSGGGILTGFAISMKRSKNTVTVFVVRVEFVEK
jgi:uncharacterized protein YkwD